MNENAILYDKSTKSFSITPIQIEQFFKSFTHYYRSLKGIDNKCKILEELSNLYNDNKEHALEALKREVCSTQQYVQLLDEGKRYKTCSLAEKAKDNELNNFLGSISIKFNDFCNPLIDIKNPDNVLPNFDKIQKSKPNLYTPFRLLDGNFNFYFEICIGGSSSCKSLKSGTIGMKTMIGTIEISDKATALSNGIDFVYPREYTFISPSGTLAREFIKDLGNFPSMLENHLKSTLSTTVISNGLFQVKTSESVFKYISIKAKYNFTAFPALFELKEINDASEEKITNASEEVTTNNYDPDIIRVKMQLPSEQHYCLMSLTKSKLELHKIDIYRTKFNDKLTKNVIKILSDTEQLTVQKSFLKSTVSEDFVYIDLPKSLKKELASKLEYTDSNAKAAFLDIVINTAVYEEELNNPIEYIIKELSNKMVIAIKAKIEKAGKDKLENTEQYKDYNNLLNDLYNGCGPLNHYLQKAHLSGETHDDGGDL